MIYLKMTKIAKSTSKVSVRMDISFTTGDHDHLLEIHNDIYISDKIEL
jgi:hypothetical protein